MVDLNQLRQLSTELENRRMALPEVVSVGANAADVQLHSTEAIRNALQTLSDDVERFISIFAIPLPPTLGASCFGRTVAGDTTWKMRSTPIVCQNEVGDDLNLIGNIPPDNPVAIHKRIFNVNEDRWWYLVNVTNRVSNPQGVNPREVNPLMMGWVAGEGITPGDCNMESITILEQFDHETSDCSNPTLISEVPGVSDYPIIQPPDQTGQYYDAWAGIRAAVDYAALHPDGWWGPDGLDLWELTGWVATFEIVESLRNPNNSNEDIWNLITNDIVPGLYQRLRIAIEQGANAGPNYNAWIQFFSGLTPTVWAEVQLEEDEFGNEIITGDSANNSFGVFIAGESPFLQGTVEKLISFSEDYDSLPRDQVPRDAIYWWTWSEISCDKRSQYGRVGVSQLPERYWQRRPSLSDCYLYLGNINMFEYAEVARLENGESVKICDDNNLNNCP